MSLSASPETLTLKHQQAGQRVTLVRHCCRFVDAHRVTEVDRVIQLAAEQGVKGLAGDLAGQVEERDFEGAFRKGRAVTHRRTDLDVHFLLQHVQLERRLADRQRNQMVPQRSGDRLDGFVTPVRNRIRRAPTDQPIGGFRPDENVLAGESLAANFPNADIESGPEFDCCRQYLDPLDASPFGATGKRML